MFAPTGSADIPLLGLSFSEFDKRIRGAAFVISGIEYVPPAWQPFQGDKIPLKKGTGRKKSATTPGNKMAMKRRVPAEVFPPGEYLQDFLDGKEWTRDELAVMLGRSKAHINRLISGETRITAEVATELADAFDTSAELWLNLQKAYDNNRPKAGKIRKSKK